MAKFQQGEAVVSFDNTSDVLTDFSTGVKTASFNISRDAAQEAHIGATWKDGFVGSRMVTGSMEVYVDDATSSAYEALAERVWDSTLSETITLQIDQPDSSNGSIRYSGEVQVIGGDESRDRNNGDGAVATFNWQSTGAWTKAVISA